MGGNQEIAVALVKVLRNAHQANSLGYSIAMYTGTRPTDAEVSALLDWMERRLSVADNEMADLQHRVSILEQWMASSIYTGNVRGAQPTQAQATAEGEGA